MQLEDIYALVSEDMDAVNRCIQQRLHSEVVLVNQIGHYIVNSGGKRLRPVLHLLCSRACGYTDTQHIELAAIIEFIHTATLLHDDVVDASELRRGNETANQLWGNEASVLVGDFLYSRAFQMMVSVGSMRVMEILAEATNTIAEGEVRQLLNVHDSDTTEERYLQVIRGKTAKLFESASRLAAVLTNQTDATEEALARFGIHLGCSFQLIDDALDYGSSGTDIGKNIGDDLAEGKPTLPLIYTIQKGTPEQAAVVRRAIEEGGKDYIDEVMAAIESTGAIDYTARFAKQEAERAKDALAGVPASQYRDALLALCDFAVARSY